LSGKFIVCSDNSGFRNTLIHNQGSFNLGGTQPVTTHVDDVVNAAADPIESFMITACTVASKLE
jgi:hypothetical protein